MQQKKSRKTDFLGTAKCCFFKQNFGALLDARVMHLFEISAKIADFLYPLQPFSTFLMGSATIS